eukprot:8015014-Ditylum_brightwellii.AAC.1
MKSNKNSNHNAATKPDEIKNGKGKDNDANNDDNISLINKLSMPTSTASEADDETELDVLTQQSMQQLLENPQVLANAMKEMHLRTREKGSISGKQKFKLLRGRWYGAKREKLKEKEKTIERGSVVTFDDTEGVKCFVVYDVDKIDVRKWHISPKNDHPAWPINKKESKKYRLTVRELEIDAVQHIWLKPFESNQDGINRIGQKKLLPEMKVQSF